MDMVRQHLQLPAAAQDKPPTIYANLGRLPNRPPDMPIYTKDFMKVEAMPAK